MTLNQNPRRPGFDYNTVAPAVARPLDRLAWRALEPGPAFSGNAVLVRRGDQFAMARWTAEGWKLAWCGIPLDFEPNHWSPSRPPATQSASYPHVRFELAA